MCVHKQNIVLLLNGQLSFKIALVLTAQQKDFLQSRSKELEITYLYMLYTDFRETQIFHKLTSLLNAFLWHVCSIGEGTDLWEIQKAEKEQYIKILIDVWRVVY